MNANINRRSALAVTGASLTAALAGVSASVAVAAETEHPWAKARRLADELSEVLAEGDGFGTGPGGKWSAQVYPVGYSDYPIGFGNISAHERPKRHVSWSCQKVIAAHREARAAFCKAIDGVDRIALGREPSKAAQRRYRKANRAEEDALVEVCGFRAYGRADAKAKAAYLMPYVRSGELNERHIAALVNSMVLA